MREERQQLNSFRYKLSIFLFFCFWAFPLLAGDLLPKTGNFSLKSSQQPGPLVSFGQTILSKHQFRIDTYPESFQFKGGYTTLAPVDLSYGLSDTLTLEMTVPVVLQAKLDDFHSSGLSDLELQLEYAYYANETKKFSEQGTVLAQLSFPTGSVEKIPATGLGAMSLLIGTTFERTYEKWYGFFSSGIIVNDSYHASNASTQYLYQCGIGHNIHSRPSRWTFNWLIEIDGSYSTAHIKNFLLDENSGGNLIYVTPSLWFSTPILILGTGLGYAVSQNLLGNQQKDTYLWVMDFSLTFG